jgi:hypothetical protein
MFFPYFRICLYFVNISNNCLHFFLNAKGHLYGYLMKGLDLGSKIMLFIFQFFVFVYIL